MLWAAGIALIILIFSRGGEDVVQTWGKKDFRSAESQIELVVLDEARQALILESLDEIRDLEKGSGKKLNSIYRKIIKLGAKHDTTRLDYESQYVILDHRVCK